jgi:hypothetical protein
MLVNVTNAELAGNASQVQPGSFEPSLHFYPRALNAQLHPLVRFFLLLSPERIVHRYTHLNPRVVPEKLEEILAYRPKYFRWAGSDLFHVTTETGNRQMVVLETNSCPSGNKSMPIPSDEQEEGGYRTLMETAFVPLLARRGLPKGGLALLYDKNATEVRGYAAALADLTGEPVWVTPLPADAESPAARFEDGVLYVRDDDAKWHPIRAAMRYVTQQPWNRIPVSTRTLIFNPVIACLAGGRNKLVAAKAYDFYNAELMASGLEIRAPETVRDVRKEEIPLWVNRFGGNAVVKIPYSNAGVGVYTIVGEEELNAFMETEQRYNQFIVQALIGNHRWSSMTRRGRLYQVGTVPNRRKEIFVADLRMMVCAGRDGFRPLAIYARRARHPLPKTAISSGSSWDVLGTNLSTKTEGGWSTDADRLMLMDRRDFNLLGVGLDDLVEAYIQSVLSAIAIDKLAQQLINQKGKLRRKLFRSLNDDPKLMEELCPQ